MPSSRAGAAISIDMGGTKIYGIVQGFSGEVLSERTIPTHGDGSADNFEQLARLIEGLRQDAVGNIEVRGLGIGVPGMTDGERVIAAPALRWLNEPVGERLRARFGLPVVVENDVNLAALGEYGYGAALGASSLVCVAVGTGIGAGIVVGGRLLRGAHFSAGEIGYMLVDPAQVSQSYSDADFGAFEQVASGSGIQARARAALVRAGRSHDAAQVSSETVVTAALAGEAWAQAVIDETVAYLTVGLTSVTAILDPEVIVLTGGVLRAPELFVSPIVASLRRLIPFSPRVVVSTLGPRAAAFGATALLAEHLETTAT